MKARGADDAPFAFFVSRAIMSSLDPFIMLCTLPTLMSRTSATSACMNAPRRGAPSPWPFFPTRFWPLFSDPNIHSDEKGRVRRSPSTPG